MKFNLYTNNKLKSKENPIIVSYDVTLGNADMITEMKITFSDDTKYELKDSSLSLNTSRFIIKYIVENEDITKNELLDNMMVDAL